MARFKNVSGQELLLFARAGQAESLAVPPDGVVDVPGDVTADLGDAVVVGEGDDARAWPKAVWKSTKPGDTGVSRAELGKSSVAEGEDRANALAQANVAASTGTVADTDGAATGGTTSNKTGA